MAWRVFALVLLVGICGCKRPLQTEFLLLLTVDTLRADHLGVYGNQLGLTPQIDSLASSAQVFDNAFTPVPFTLPAVAALHSGRYPTEVNVTDNRVQVVHHFPKLAQLFQQHGWRTGAVVSNFVLRRASGLEAGFERYDDRFPQVELNRPDVPERIARFTTDAALRLLDELSAGKRRPVFLWVHYQDPHGPYLPPAGFRERYLASEPHHPGTAGRLAVREDDRGVAAIPRYQCLWGHRDPAYYRAGYKGEIAYLDAEIGRLRQGLEMRGLFERATIVFAADHGEGMGEDDYWFAHGEMLTDPHVRVPLFIRLPGEPGRRRTDPASLLDLFPTLLARYAIEHNEGYPGRDLLAPEAERSASTVVLANLKSKITTRLGLVLDGFKYRMDVEDELLVAEHLSPLADESTDITRQRPELAVSMREKLLALLQEFSAAAPARRQSLSASDEEKLRALGYTGP